MLYTYVATTSLKLNLSDINDKQADIIITDVPLSVEGVWTL
jgi:hypothetical protein